MKTMLFSGHYVKRQRQASRVITVESGKGCGWPHGECPIRKNSQRRRHLNPNLKDEQNFAKKRMEEQG